MYTVVYFFSGQGVVLGSQWVKRWQHRQKLVTNTRRECWYPRYYCNHVSQMSFLR